MWLFQGRAAWNKQADSYYINVLAKEKILEDSFIGLLKFLSLKMNFRAKGNKPLDFDMRCRETRYIFRQRLSTDHISIFKCILMKYPTGSGMIPISNNKTTINPLYGAHPIQLNNWSVTVMGDPGYFLDSHFRNWKWFPNNWLSFIGHPKTLEKGRNPNVLLMSNLSFISGSGSFLKFCSWIKDRLRECCFSYQSMDWNESKLWSLPSSIGGQ